MANLRGISKLLLYILNTLIIIFGIIFVIIGSIAKSKPEGNESKISGAAIFLIVVGCLMVAIAILGIISVKINNKLLLILYCILILIIFIFTLIILSICFYFRGNEDYINHILNDTRKEIKLATSSILYDHIQKDNKCCGVDNGNEWLEFYKKNKYFPSSCCDSGSCTYQNIYKKGCKEHFFDDYHQNLTTIAFISIFVAIVTFLSLTFGIILIIKKDRNSMNP